jgi:gliding motility-associated-like protein
MSGSYAVFAIAKYAYFYSNPYNFYSNWDTLYCRSNFQGVTNISVNPTPAAPILSNITYCQDDPTVPLTAIGTNILWYPNALAATIGSSIAPTPYDSLPGNTTWWASQTSAAGCTSPKSAMTVTVLQKSIPPYIPNPVITYCQGDVAQLLNVIGTNLKFYTVAVGGTGTYIVPTPNTTVAGTTVWYVSQSTNGCESDRAPITVVVKQRPQLPIVHDVTYCQNDIATQLTGLGQNLRWYTTAVGGLGATTGPVPSTLLPDTLHYYVTESVNGCESYRVEQNVIVLYTPNAVIVPGKPYVCEDSDMSFTYFGSALPNASYDWGLPTDTKWDSGRGVGPIWVHFDSPGHKIITLIVTNVICKSPTAKFDVLVRPKPHQSIGSLHEVCELQPMTVGLGLATAGVSSYKWTWDSVNTSNIGATILSTSGPEGPYKISWNSPGEHYITVQSILNGCASDVNVDTVNVHPVPDARIDFDTSNHPCTNDSVLYKAKVAEDQNLYLWTPEHYFIYGNNTAYVIGNVYANSYIKLQVTTPFGCIAADSLWISTDSCCRMNFPNAFTPNGDGLNDIFRPDIYEKGHHVIKAFRIANRYGQIVFESLDEKHGWDGKFNGVPQDMDTYYWYCDYICSYNNQQYRERGEVYLIR